ncbi:YTX2 protein, partial [Polypterus senegalus]
MKISSINVRSIQNTNRREIIYHALKQTDADIICLQECTIPYANSYKYLESGWDEGKAFFSGTNKSRSAGIGIIVKGSHLKIKNYEEIIKGRVANLEVITEDRQETNIINVYAPTDKQERCDVLEKLNILLLRQKRKVVVGDFNCVIDEVGGRRPDKSAKLLKTIIKEHQLKDTYREVNKIDKGYTWTGGRGEKKSRIDMILTSTEATVISFRIQPVFFSDHQLITAEIKEGRTIQRGKGYWKLNITLLEDKEIKAKYERKYKEWTSLKDACPNQIEWWDIVKEKTKAFFQIEGKKKKHQQTQELKKLQQQLEEYYKIENAGIGMGSEIQEGKRKIEEYYREEEKKIKFHSRVKEMEEGERCTSFFFKKIKEKKNKTQLKEIKTSGT